MWDIKGVFYHWRKHCGADILQVFTEFLSYHPGSLTYLVLQKVSRCWLYVSRQAVCLDVLSEGSFIWYQKFSLSFSLNFCRNECGICVCAVNKNYSTVIMICIVMAKYWYEICHFHLCYSELQRIILELVAQLAHYKISPKELSLYLNIFKFENPPLVSIIMWCVKTRGHKVLIKLCSVLFREMQQLEIFYKLRTVDSNLTSVNGTAWQGR